MTKRGLIAIIFVLLITNVFSLIYFTQSRGTNDIPSDELNDLEEGLTDNNIKNADDFVASFGDRHITYKEWMSSLRETHGKNHLETMITNKVVENLVGERSLTVNEKVIDREVSFLTTMSGLLSDEQLAEHQEQWKQQLNAQYQLEVLLTEDVGISDEEIQAHYNQYQNQYDFSASFQLSHIVVEDMSTADKVIDELNEGALFHLLAQEYSIDEETRDAGGYLGYFTKGSQFIPYGYDNIISNLDDQSFSKPVDLGDRVVIVFLHRDLPEITFTFDELKDHIAIELALKQVDQQRKLQEIWEEQNIDWIFNE